MGKKIKRGLNRRSFLQTTAAAGAAAGFGSSLFPGGARAAQSRGGILRAARGHGSTPDTLTPGMWGNDFVNG
ncbi:MAG: twin-arginine translocation signal domain-containing protein, partial [Neomegalonema sp.]